MGKLSGKYCIVGIGESVYARGAGRSTSSLAAEAARNAIIDAGIQPWELNGAVGYMDFDGPGGTDVAGNLGFRLQYQMDLIGQGAAADAQVGAAIAALEEGNCDLCIIFRGLNGYTEQRLGHKGVRGGMNPVFGTWSIMGNLGSNPVERIYGWQSPAQRLALTAMRHMMEYGTTNSQMAAVKVAHSRAASNNPKAIYKQRVTAADVLNSPWVVKPFHRLDCAVEVDGAAAVIIAPAERAFQMRQSPVFIQGVAGRTGKVRADWEFAKAPITVTSQVRASRIALGMAGITPDAVDITQASDNTTWTTIAMLEDAGYCDKGEGGDYVASGIIELGGGRPNGTSGGHLSEAYVDGMSILVETVRQLRGQADDYCPGAAQGKHSYDYSEGGCRQVQDANIAHIMSSAYWLNSSSLVLSRAPRL